MRTLLPVFLAGLLLAPSALLAQQSPSVGIPAPDGSIATQTDSASLEINPAGLGYLEGSEVSYGFFLPTADFRGTLPSGHSLMFAAGSPSAGFGLGVQWLDNPLLGPERAVFRKYTLGGGLSSRYLSLGGNLNYYGSRYDERLNALRTADLGLQWRPGHTLGLGVMAKDVSPAFLDPDRSLETRLGIGLALRFFDGRLVFDTELHSVRRADRMEIRPRLAGEPIEGLRLFGTGLLTSPVPTATSGSLVFEGLTVGVEASMGTFGIQAAAHLQEDLRGDGVSTSGIAYRAWAGSLQKRSLFTLGDRWVRVPIDGRLAEQASAPVFGDSTRSFLNFINNLRAISEDPSVGGVILDLQSVQLGYSQIWELHEAMEGLRASGKESIALLRNPNLRSIYAATAADSIWIAPFMSYAPAGLASEFVSFAGLLDRYGVEAQFVRIGDYKSAPEAYVMGGPSDSAREQTSELLDGLYAELTQRIASRRGMETAEFVTLLEDLPIFPATALERGLVDAVVYSDELEEELRSRLGRSVSLERSYSRQEIADVRWGGRPEIAVVYVDGMIIDGSSGGSPFGGSSLTGAESLTRTLRALREDNTVKAVVVRIDSPGGSALASDVIYRELRQLAAVKPVIASMSNVAASGGYYVAAGADEIFATPLTVTGSIGVFTGKFNVEVLAERLGIATERQERGEGAGFASLFTPWNEEELQSIARTLDYLYQLFLQQIERTRPLTADEIDAVARGRVWNGTAAKEVGLVDHVGGFSHALARAEELAGIAPGQAVYVDRTGLGGLQMSPGMATRVQAMLARMGLQSEETLSIPDGDLPRALRELETSLLWPLYFSAGEAVAMPPYLPVLR